MRKNVTYKTAGIIVITLINSLLYKPEASPRMVTSNITYRDGVEAGNYTFEGLCFNKDKENKIPKSPYNYSKNYSDEYYDFLAGLSTISTYMSTGSDKYLQTAKDTADFLSKNLPSSNLLPVYSAETRDIVKNQAIFTGTGGQASFLEYLAYLARIDLKYMTLMNRSADGLIKHCLNPNNNLAWFQVDALTGKPIKSSIHGYESQLGSQSVSCAQALLCAYETDKNNETYKNKAIDILLSIWELRNKETNLISETYDVMNNHLGQKLYPAEDFRYDDMGGAYIRGLTMAYLVTKDKRIEHIAKQYIPALMNTCWDNDMNEGAFIYLVDTNGKIKADIIETMHGLFLATLLEANEVFYDSENNDIIRKCSINAQHTIIDKFAVKNNMCPHAIGKNGGYVNSHNDSQLGYSVLQYPLGYELISQKTGNNKYRLENNAIFRSFLDKHKIGDNIKSPKGFINILETKPPYGFESEYMSPAWMLQSSFIPAYLLFNSIHPSKEVKINWYHGTAPNIFGLVNDMPFWDLNSVSVEKDKIKFNEVTGKGTVDFNDLGYNIIKVLCDGKDYSNNINNNILSTRPGTHCYEIFIER